MRTCTIDGCNRPHLARGWCGTHHSRWQRWGDPHHESVKPRPAIAALEALLESSPDTDDCILWQFSKSSRGYGQVTIDTVKFSVHVLICEHHYGPRPLNHEAAHWCGNASCVNWRNLRWATRAENQADRLRHGTHQLGEQNAYAKLMAADVLEIRLRALTESGKTLAREFGISYSHLRDIVNRVQWAWLDPLSQ